MFDRCALGSPRSARKERSCHDDDAGPRTGFAAAVKRDPETHVTRHLVAVSSAVRLRMRRGLSDRGHDLSASTTQLVPNLPLEGMGMSELSQHVGMSLQRTGQLVQQLEDDGYVTRERDENDGRAKRVVYTDRGRQLLGDIDALLETIEAEFVEVLGATRFRSLVRDLARIDRALNGEGEAVLPVLESEAKRHRS